MLLDPAAGVHLTYCTNIHPGETWAQTRHAISTHVPVVKAAVAPDHPFGVGLRLSAAAADGLSAPGALEDFADTLENAGLYVFTINGFPYGPFHGQPVKQEVYRPDWTERARVTYTDRLIDILAQLLPTTGDLEGSISTVPGCFHTRGGGDAPAIMAGHLIDRACRLWALRERGGPSIALALEPEPCCHLETVAQTIAFFETHLVSTAALQRFERAMGVSRTAAEAGLRRHLTVCLDTCHAAVEFEHPREAVRAFAAAGIGLGKVQVTTGLHLATMTDPSIAALARFADAVYLHQVVVQTEQGLVRFEDLAPALEAHARGELAAGPWRVHFHVPVFQRDLGPFTNTQDFLCDTLHEVQATAACRHLELETYTWDVLPPQYRNVDVDEAIARELDWVIQKWGRWRT